MTGLWWGIGCLVAALTIPVIVAIIGLLAAIAIPSFVKARETAQINGCINNMRILDAAKEQAALAHAREDGDAIPEAEFSPYIKGGFGGLLCPSQGDYTVNPLGQDPECSVHGELSNAGMRRRSMPQRVNVHR